MKKTDWIINWFKQDKRYLTLCKALLLALLPFLCCLVACRMQGKSIGEVYLPSSEWNDELFYYKQVESIVKFGFPQGYYGFNESHGLRLSFAAWSPALVLPWIVWGCVFGWNFLSPVICNILLMTLAVFLFALLVKPTWKQMGILTLLFSLYTLFPRYMLSGMPEIMCISHLIVFYGLAVSFGRGEKRWKLVGMFVLSGLLTLMRPYMLLFLMLPVYFWIRDAKRRGKLLRGICGSGVVTGAVLVCYALIKHFFGAEYFHPLFFTDWITTFFTDGFGAGVHNFFSTLYWKGKDFYAHTVQGLRTGLASGAFFAGYMVMLAVLLWQSATDARRFRKMRRDEAAADRRGESGVDEAQQKEVLAGGQSLVDAQAASGVQSAADVQKPGRLQGSAAGRGQSSADVQAVADVQSIAGRQLEAQLTVEAHLAISFIGMFFALLLMYKLTEGSKHLLTFIAVGIFVVSLMDTRFFKKAVLLGAVFAYLYSYKAADPYDYQIPFVTAQRQEQVADWQGRFAGVLVLTKEAVPNYDNVVIWVFNEQNEVGETMKWQLLYALPEGYGISCCQKDFVLDNFDTLQSQYIVAQAGAEVDETCSARGWTLLARDEDIVVYRR